MIRFLSCVVGCVFAFGIAEAGEDPVPVASGPGILHTSNGSSLVAARETAGPDTFAIYGGPDRPTEGKFQLADGVTPDWGGGNGLPGGYGGGPDAWSPVDLTEQPLYWHVDTFNAENLNDNGPGNHAMWCGLAADDPRGADFAHVPGYGNSWDQVLLYEAPAANPSGPETIDLDFFYNFDYEPGYNDEFTVEYDSAGSWIEVMRADDETDDHPHGSNKDQFGVFPVPGERFTDHLYRPITYSGFDYGLTGDKIAIRLRFKSAGAWSDEDGLWPTDAGAVQLDDISLTHAGGSWFEDFEGSGPWLFEPTRTEVMAGDFADLYPRISDIDPCRENTTPVAGFLDYDQVVRNGPNEAGVTRTGGSTSAGVNYGIQGNWVTNYTGGLSEGVASLMNEVWSPEIQWDLPGPADDDDDVVGAFIRFDVWADLPVLNGIFYAWHVRTARPGHDIDLKTWWDRNFIYFNDGVAGWYQERFDVTDLLERPPERVQMALGVWDFAAFYGFPGTAATPSPVFDNAAFYKYRVGGPAITAKTIDMAQDGFPIVDSIDVSTPAARDALDIPFSMARDVNTGQTLNTPGDSVIVDVGWSVAGGGISSVRMVWALSTNPVFEDAMRSAPSRSKDQSVVAGPAGSVWTGEVIAGASGTSAGSLVLDRYFVDLPDVDFMYPGDVLQYYIRATDYAGRVSTLPADVTGFGDFSAQTLYERAFTVRGLPSISDTSGTQPDLLVINDFGRRGGEAEFTLALRNLGLSEGIDYDTYTVQGPSSTVSNGIGSSGAHGATAGQLSGYDDMFYLAGDLRFGLLSDGSNTSANDKGDDIGVLEAWHALGGGRDIAYFGNYIGNGLEGGSLEGRDYLALSMGVDLVTVCGNPLTSSCGGVSDAIGGQTAPVVVPGPVYASSFSTTFVAYGACPTGSVFDHIQPLPGAQVGHYFTDRSGTPIGDPSAGVASVINHTGNGLHVTFPYGHQFVWDIATRSTGPSARSQLFGELLTLFGSAPGTYPPVAAPSLAPVALSTFPNPFNPSTTVKFTAAPGSRGSVKVFNTRGELVRTLHTGEFAAQEFRWDGTDTRGAPVGSGVYLIRATDGKITRTQKVALVK